MIEKDLIYLDVDVSNQSQCFQFLADKLLKKGYVTPSFLQALHTREEKYPTGLDFIENFGVAIPHVEIEHCKKDSITFLKPIFPIPFRDMETGEYFIPARYIFMITLTNSDQHIDLLQILFTTLSNEEFFQGLAEREKIQEEVFYYLTNWLIKA